MKLQQTDALYRHTATEEWQLVQNLIDEFFRLLVCSNYSYVCFYHRLSPLVVLPTNITVTSPGEIKLGQCRTTRIACRHFRGRSIRKIIRLDYFCFLFLKGAPSRILELIHRVLTWIFPDSLSNTCPATIISKIYPPQLWLAGALAAIGWGVTLLVGTGTGERASD